MNFFELLQTAGWLVIIIGIVLLTICIKLILAIFKIRDNTERTALIMEAIARQQNIELPTEYTKNFNENHYN